MISTALVITQLFLIIFRLMRILFAVTCCSAVLSIKLKNTYKKIGQIRSNVQWWSMGGTNAMDEAALECRLLSLIFFLEVLFLHLEKSQTI